MSLQLASSANISIKIAWKFLNFIGQICRKDEDKLRSISIWMALQIDSKILLQRVSSEIIGSNDVISARFMSSFSFHFIFSLKVSSFSFMAHLFEFALCLSWISVLHSTSLRFNLLVFTVRQRTFFVLFSFSSSSISYFPYICWANKT